MVVDGQQGLAPADVLSTVLMHVYDGEARQLVPGNGGIPTGGVDADGHFETIGLPPGRYVLDPYARIGKRMYAMTSVQVDGREVFDVGLDLGTSDLTDVVVTLSSRTWEVSGSVRGQDGRAIAGARVILFPQDRSRWYTAGYDTPRRIAHAAADRGGVFRVTGALADSYLIAAGTNPPEFWMAPEYLETLVPIATPVRLDRDDRRTVDLRIR